MKQYNFTGQLKELIDRANNGKYADIDLLMKKLSKNSSFALTRYVDFALSLVKNSEGIDHIKYYLFHGTLIQCNYACLFFNRLGEWSYVKEAWERGLIDEIQAFSR